MNFWLSLLGFLMLLAIVIMLIVICLNTSDIRSVARHLHNDHNPNNNGGKKKNGGHHHNSSSSSSDDGEHQPQHHHHQQQHKPGCAYGCAPTACSHIPTTHQQQHRH